MPGSPNPPVTSDDSEIDAIVSTAIAKVGESPAIIAASEKLQRLFDEAAVEPKPLVDPRSLPWRFSRLKTMDRSPAHYFDACQRPFDKRSLALRLGGGVHGLLFGEIGVDVGLYTGHRAGKLWDREVAKYRDGTPILNELEWVKAWKIVRAIRRNEIAMQLFFDDTVREREIAWKLGERSCSSRPDVLHRGRKHITELKTTRNGQPHRFQRDSFNFHYHAQLAFYDEAQYAESGTRVDDLYIVAVETDDDGPHPVTVYRIPDELRQQGIKTWSLWTEKLAVCEASDQWPEYAQGVVQLEAPFELGEDVDSDE
jgi:hypothetical protein